MEYRKCGNSGIQLPEISLGLWHNFGGLDNFGVARSIVLHAFDNGICHFDLANNYGPPPGSAESNFGKILKYDLSSHRDEMFISSKAGHDMWPGVYGTGLEYFDVFYTHRYDAFTPLEETLGALISLVHAGKALYAGISKYPPAEQQRAYEILRDAGVPCLVSQYRASIFDTRAIEDNFQCAADNGSGIVCFSPLAQGLLTDRYLHGIPADSRAAGRSPFLTAGQVTPGRLEAIRRLNDIASARHQPLSSMALDWLLADPSVASVIVGASSVAQLTRNLDGLSHKGFTPDELAAISSAASASGAS